MIFFLVFVLVLMAMGYIVINSIGDAEGSGDSSWSLISNAGGGDRSVSCFGLNDCGGV